MSGLCSCFLAARFADVSGLKEWKGLTWGMLPLHTSGLVACTYHIFYNSPELISLVAMQVRGAVCSARSMSFGWLVCWLVCWLVYWLVCSLVGWFGGWLVGWSIRFTHRGARSPRAPDPLIPNAKRQMPPRTPLSHASFSPASTSARLHT